MFQMPTKRRENPLQLRIAASLDDAATVKYCSVKEVYLATSPEISGGGIVLILATSRGSLGKLEMEVIWSETRNKKNTWREVIVLFIKVARYEAKECPELTDENEWYWPRNEV